MNPLDIPPAFPEVPGDNNAYEGRAGMTLRDWFAGQALAGMAANPEMKRSTTNADYANMAYSLAYSMLIERERRQP